MNVSGESLTSDETYALVVALALHVAKLEDVDVDTDDPVTIISRTRRQLRRSSYEVRTALVPQFGSSSDDVVCLELVRVIKPVTDDASLITSQTIPVNQTDDQVDQANEEK